MMGDLLGCYPEGGSDSLMKLQESLKRQASFPGAKRIVQRIYSFL